MKQGDHIRNLKLYFIIAVTVGLLSGVGSYIYAVNSEAYVVAKEYVATDPEVVSRLGFVKSSSLLLIGFSMRNQNGKTTATFRLNVDGEKETDEVALDMIRVGDEWKVLSATFGNELRAGQKYKIIKPVYLTGEYIDRGNKVLSNETAIAYLDSYKYAMKSYTAFKTEVPIGTVMDIIGPAPKAWYLFFQGDFYFIKLDPDMSQGLDIKLQLDRGMEGNLDGLNPEIFSRMAEVQ